MGVKQDIRLAGDARRRQLEGMAQRRRAAATSEGGQQAAAMLQSTAPNSAVIGEFVSPSPEVLRRQEMFAARPEVITPIQTQNPQPAPGIEPSIPGPGRIFEGSPEYEQYKQRLRALTLYGDRGRYF